jgi:probable F420-dependent oxidoreductase
VVEYGISLPVVQQLPGRAQSWEGTAGTAEILQVARAADRLGYGWIGCSDHVAIPASYVPSMGAIWYDPATTLAYCAAATERIGLLSHVVVLPYRHPLVAAKAFATLDALSGGRVIIGAGSGHLRPEFRSLGIDPDARATLAEEYAAALATALEHEVSSFAGARVAWRDMAIAPRPAQRPRPPIWLGGNSSAMARLAGRLADGWIPWRIDEAAFASRAAAALAEHAARGRGGRFTLVAPLAAGRVRRADAVRDAIRRWRAHGATAFHVGFAPRSAAEYVELLERFRGCIG